MSRAFHRLHGGAPSSDPSGREEANHTAQPRIEDHPLLAQLAQEPRLARALLRALPLDEVLAASLAQPETLKSLATHISARELAALDALALLDAAAPSLKEHLKRRLAADERTRERAALAFAISWVGPGLCLAVYGALVAELLLTASGWLLLLAYLRTRTWRYSLVHLLPHTARCVLLARAARVLPTAADLVRRWSVVSNETRDAAAGSREGHGSGRGGASSGACGGGRIRGVASGGGRGGSGDRGAGGGSADGSGGLMALLRPARRHVSNLASVTSVCVLADTVGLMGRVFAITSAYPEGEDVAEAVLVLLILPFLALDALPLLVWPLLRWALPEERRAELLSALEAPWSSDPAAYNSHSSMSWPWGRRGARGVISAGARRHAGAPATDPLASAPDA